MLVSHRADVQVTYAGAGSFVTRGRGNASSWSSCSHGAGRKMSRTKAKEHITQVACSPATVTLCSSSAFKCCTLDSLLQNMRIELPTE